VTTLELGKAIVDWLGADPSHVVVIASVVAALTQTPQPGTTAYKIYKLLDLFALNFLHAKDTGAKQVPVNDIAKVVLDAVAQLTTQGVNTAAPASKPADAANNGGVS